MQQPKYSIDSMSRYLMCLSILISSAVWCVFLVGNYGNRHSTREA